MNALQMLEAIFSHIRQNGFAEPVTHPRLGGCWSADTYKLNGWIAQLADDGSSRIVRRGTFMANTTYGRPVQYFDTGAESDLIDLYNEVFPPPPVQEERTFYIWL